MVGYIISVNRAHDEDVVVTILSEGHLYTLYRFYGARHSTVNLGYKIDFEIESDVKSPISRLRHITHLGFTWIAKRQHMLLWQQLCQLFYTHLRENETLDSFYFELLDHAAQIWDLQNPKRIAVELYTRLLQHEGRLHTLQSCFICELPIKDEDPALVRAFLPAHTHCAYTKTFPKKALDKLMHENNSIELDDKEIDRLYNIMCEGL